MRLLAHFAMVVYYNVIRRAANKNQTVSLYSYQFYKNNQEVKSYWALHPLE
jgi:hypothetical protein